MKLEKIMALLLACVMTAFLYAGCNKTDESDKTAAKTGSSETGSVVQTTEDSNMIGNMYKSGFPIVKDKVTLKFAAGQLTTTVNFDEIETFKELEEKTNVHIEWDLIPQQGFNERKSLILASGDLPDAFFGTGAGGITEEEIVTYGSQGVFVPLEEYIDNYSPNLTNVFQKLPDAKRIVTSLDGHIYSLPFIQEVNSNTVYTRMFINKTWLDKLKLSIPATTEEFHNVLEAFKENDLNGNGKNDEIPLSFMYKNHNNGHYALFGAFGCLDSVDHVMLKDNKVVITATMSEYKEAVKYMNSLYKDGLIDAEAFTHDLSQYKAKGQQSDMLYGVYFDWGGTAVAGADRYKNNYVPLAPLKEANGDQLWPVRTPAIWSGYFVMTSQDKYPEITLRWVNELYDEKVSMQLQYGPLGINLKENADGKIEILDPPEGMTANDFRYNRAPGIAPCAILADTFNNKMILNTTMKNDDSIYQVYAPYLPKEFLPISNLKFTKEQNTRLAALKTDILTYIDSTQAKWITGDSSIDADWDNYIKELNKMGIDELQKIYQDAYDTYMK